DPVKKLNITDVIKFDQGESPGIEVRFSDILDPSQDIEGLVSITPDLKISSKSVNKSIFITGGFEFGKHYSVKVSGIKSKWGNKIEKDLVRGIDFEDKKPQVSFVNEGIFLPTVNEQKIGFKTINISNVKVIVKRVFESNLGQFLQTETLAGSKKRTSGFNYYNMNRVGVQVAEKTLNIGKEKNRWLVHQLDLKKLIKQDEKGIFIIELSFTRKDMLYRGLKKKRSYYYGKDYYSNPNSYGYLYRHGKIFKPVIQSDIGLTYKRGSGQHFVLTTDLVDSSPMGNVNITLRTFQNQVLSSKRSDSDGKTFFKDIKEKVFYIEGEKDGQRSIIKPSEMGWNLSSFDTGGVISKKDKTRVFIYTERGVYRPGDNINLSLIARNSDNTFPENHPVILQLFNPRNQLIKKIVQKKGEDGFYNFYLKTKESDPTGNWRAKLLVGGTTFFHTLKIETVVPFKLKVKIDLEKPGLDFNDKALDLTLRSNYLFGTPSSFLDAETSIALKSRYRIFNKFHGFLFSNEILKFKYFKTNIFEGKLDKNGLADVKWTLPELKNVPSAITAEITAKVYEKGGRATTNTRIIPIDPYKLYVGLEKPRFRYGYSTVGSPVKINSILVSKDGDPVSGRSLKYKIYKNSRYWWWEYDSLTDFKVKYKKDHYTRLLKEGIVITKKFPVPIEFTPEDSGEYFIEVKENLSDSHTSGFFFSSYYWGETPEGTKSAGTVLLKSNKKLYNPGDTAVISFPKPGKGTALITIEKGDTILKAWTEKLKDDGKKETAVEIPVTNEFLPNVYISVSIIQPHSQTLNDRPIRVYGTIPVLVEENQTHQYIDIKTADRFEPNKKFSIEIQTRDKKATQMTVAIVDEGLLDLTRFITPDPWKNFFKKQKLGISTFDIFSHVIGANKGDIRRLFSIGGDITAEESYRSSQLSPKKAKRFKPVALFKGPFKTDENGYKKLTFKMPNYNGSVRIMAISSIGNRYGKKEKTIPVKTDLMLLPTLPRVLAPGDEIVVPVSVFALNKNIRDVRVSIKTKGPLTITGKKEKEIVFSRTGEKDTNFTFRVGPSVGKASILLQARSGKFKTSQETEFAIRPSSPRIYSSIMKECTPGNSIEITIPNNGIKGTNRASLSISRKAKLNIENRISWLIHYPYGCIEQTVSAVFPQLYLRKFIESSSIDTGEIDTNINYGIERLRRFLLPSGGLAYWPGNKDFTVWGTNYAFHFLIEAKKRGYNIPEDLYSRVIRFQKSRALTTLDSRLERTYRLYILALAGEPQHGAMNLLLENDLKSMSNTEKWMLAAAYYLSGKKDLKERILKGTGTETEKYSKAGKTFGSQLRDRSIILDIMTIMEDWNRADKLYDIIAEEVSGTNWFSTQTLGYSLLALGKYMQANESDFRGESSLISGYIKLPGRDRSQFSLKDLKYTVNITKGFGKKATVLIDKKTTLKRTFVTLQWNGVPLKPDVRNSSENLVLKVEWLNENGMRIDPGLLEQGSTFWGYFSVRPGFYSRSNLSELALVQVLPSGWEIENIRLSGEDLPEWLRKKKISRTKYTDIRDDRIMWFFDMPGYSKGLNFAVKLNSVTAGKFTLPPTIFEAMYKNNYKAVKKGYNVEVKRR
ncbi:MAG: MG2 domain-containing protein, partial [Acidobacteriota bacterium]